MPTPDRGSHRDKVSYRMLYRIARNKDSTITPPKHGSALAYTATLLLVLMTPYVTLAQLEPLKSLSSAGEEQLLLQEIPSVYSASKYEQKVTEAPSSVSIVTADEIKKYGYRTLDDILRSVRGFYVSYDRNYSYIGMRGFNRPGDYNTRILVMVDGHRLNDAVYDGSTGGTDFLLDVDLIDRVEIVRGPSSSLYGSNAFFGIINIITKRGRDLQGAEVAGSAGNRNTYTTRLSYGRKFSLGSEMLVSGSFFTSEGDDRLFFEAFDDPTTNNGISENNDDDRSYSVFGRFSLGDFSLEGAHVSRRKDIPTASYETSFNHPDTHTVDERSLVELQYDHNLSTHCHVLARLFYDHYYYKGDYAYDDEAGGIILNKDSATGDTVGAEAQLTTRALRLHTITFGTAFRLNLRQNQKNFDAEPFFQYLDDKRDSTYWALYLQDEFRLFSRLTLHAGLRYDHFETFGGTTNPRLAVIYDPWRRTTLKFVYGTAFRVPNVYEQFYNDGGSTQKPNADLEPETITTYELILEQYMGDYLRGTVVGFYYEIDHLITLRTDPADDLLFFVNADTVTAHGIELELEGRLSNGLTGRVSYTYQRTEDKETGDVLTDSPQHLVKLNLIAPLFRDKLFASLELQYTSSRNTLAASTTSDFFITNLTLFSQDLLQPGLSISASVYNLFDETYRDPASEEHIQDAIEQNGRSFRLKLAYAF